MESVYVLDANVFIQAKNMYYAFDIAPAFWDVLVEHAKNGRVRSIDRVKQELNKGNDDLSKWANSKFNEWFFSTDHHSIVEAYRKIMNWVQNQSQFTSSAKAIFAQGADGWLVAYAKAHGFTVVTHETYDENVKSRVKIPNVCYAFNVRYVNTFEMLRELGVSFVHTRLQDFHVSEPGVLR